MRVDDIPFPVVQRMKWHVVQQIVRHDDEMTTDRKVERREQFGVQLPKVRLRCRQRHIRDSPDVFGRQEELRELKLKEPEKFPDSRHGRHRNNLELVFCQDHGHHAIGRPEILDQDHAGPHDRSDLLEAGDTGPVKSRRLALI